MKTTYFLFILITFSINAQVNKDIETKKENNKAYIPKYFKFKVKHDIFNNQIEENNEEEFDKNPKLISKKEIYSPQVNLNLADYLKSLGSLNNGINWFEAGPNNVGGRTRALALDRNNSSTAIAAGVTGGIWKTTNSGNSWILKSDISNNYNVTSIVQHPTNANVWYASTGEVSSSANGFRSNPNLGSGTLYKSINNGETWQNLAVPQTSNNYLYLTSKLAISPTTNTFFVATNGFGIARSTDSGISFTNVLGNPNGTYNLNLWTSNFMFCDVVVNQNGVLLAQISGELSAGAGFYKSINDGVTWTNITPATFVALTDSLDIERSVLAFAPSNPNVAYAFTNSKLDALANDDNIHFHKINVSAGLFEDRSNNLPKITYNNGADVYRLPSSQQNYDMCLAVKPNDENFVIIAGQSGPYRTFDGFTTDAGSYPDWYGPNGVMDSPASVCSTSYPHPDQHVVVFNPTNPENLWLGNDGGVSVLLGVTNDNSNSFWSNKNNGFNVTQFYDVAIAPVAQGNKVMGATQDNASPMMVWNSNQASPVYTNIVSGGDGISSDWQMDYIYTNGVGGSTSSVFSTTNIANIEYTFPNVERIVPSPFALSFKTAFVAVNPNNENVIFLNSGLSKLYKGTNANSWSGSTSAMIQAGLTTFDINLLGNNLADYGFSKMAFSKTPSNILYFTLSKLFENDPVANKLPKIYKLQNANTASIAAATEISSPLFPANAYVSDIVVNNLDANEFIVVFSTKNNDAVFHTTNGGLTYQNIRGNLSIGQYAPLFNCAEIVNTPNGKVYLLGTSMGLFSTMQLNDSATIWQNEALDKIGNCTITDIDYRSADSMIAVSTHGRGIFMGNATNFLSTTNYVENNLFSISPNPFKNQISLIFNKNFPEGIKILIFDVLGKLISESNENISGINQKLDINASEMTSKGIYLLKIFDKLDNNCVKTFKIIKE